MERIVYWLLPERVRPVVSLSAIRKGQIQDPKGALDRLHLTDIGDAFFKAALEGGLLPIVMRADPPFPWEMQFLEDGRPTCVLEGTMVGGSTFRSVLQFSSPVRDRPRALLSAAIERLGRDPLESRYWDDGTWIRAQRSVSKSRDEMAMDNESMLRLTDALDR